MNQRTHAWLAVRAVALLADAHEAKGLVKLLKPHLRSTAIGAWIPDLADSKKGGGDIDNHILKMKPYSGSQRARYIADKAELRKRLGTARLMNTYLRDNQSLSPTWWRQPYKAKPQPGQHLANRAMSLCTTLADLLILGDAEVARAVPGAVRFTDQMPNDALSRQEQVATHFFMLSHFVADSCMPCHCDARKLSGYSRGLHNKLEARWSRIVGAYFDKKKLFKSTDSPAKLLKAARKVDANFGLQFSNAIPRIKATDVWKEIINVCRASYALANILASPFEFPPGTLKSAPLSRLTQNAIGQTLLEEMDEVIIHDAVLNIAMTWKYIWDKFEPKKKKK
jgi:hypothetical protein